MGTKLGQAAIAFQVGDDSEIGRKPVVHQNVVPCPNCDETISGSPELVAKCVTVEIVGSERTCQNFSMGLSADRFLDDREMGE